MVKVDLTREGLSQGNFLAITVDDKLRDAQGHLQSGHLDVALDKICEALLGGPERRDVLATFAEIADRRGCIEAAVGIAEAAVAHNPESGDAHLDLIQRYVRAGQHSEAIRCAQEATRAAPVHTGVWLCLADLLWRRDRIEESVAAYRAGVAAGPIGERDALKAAARVLDSGLTGEARALLATAHRRLPESSRLAVLYGEACLADGAPGEALALSDRVAAGDQAADMACVRARAEIDCGRPISAVRTLDAVAAPGPRRADVAALRAIALRLAGDVGEARRAYARALHEVGALPRLQLGHALTLRALGLEREALAELERIDGVQSAVPTVLIERAAILTRLGRRHEAVEAVHHAVDAQGRSALVDGPALLEADLEPYMDANGLRHILQRGALSADERVGYQFALGHAESARGNHESAMRAWHAANTSIRGRYQFDVQALTAWLREVPAVCADWDAEQARDAVAGAPRPVFIVGMPRSGTSLVEHVLAAHPDVWAGGEAHTITQLIADLTRCYPDAGYPELLTRIGSGEVADLRRHILQQLAARYPGAALVTDKMPGNFAHLGLLARLFPDAVFLDCRREPLDTALSIYTQWFREGHHYAYALKEIGDVLAAHADVMAAWCEQLSHAGWNRVTYEDIVTAPESMIARLLSACDLSHADVCFAPWQQVRHVTSGSARRVERPITAERMGRWRFHARTLEPVRAQVKE